MPSEADQQQQSLRNKIIGLGERSIRKSYYPQLQQQLESAEKSRLHLEEKSVALQGMLEKLNAARKSLAASEALLRAVLETSPDAILLITADGALLETNRAGSNMFDYPSAEEAVGHSILPLCVDEFRERFRAFHGSVIQGDQGTLEFEIVGIKGTRRWVEARSVPFHHPASDAMSHLTVMRDITERKKLEAERQEFETRVHQTQRLESLGVLAGGIAHDFNNILMAIMGHAELALDEISPLSPGRESISEIVAASKRAAELYVQLLAYTGRSRVERLNMDLGDVVEETLHLLKTCISKKAILNLNLEKSLPCMHGDPAQIRQILMNLVINASEAIGERSGVINISTGAMVCSEHYLKNGYIIESPKPGTYVYIEVSDTGCGMDKKTIEHIFEPFFTTKFTGRGLGLSALLGIVKAHEGALRVYSELGKGSTFKVMFPAFEPVEEHEPKVDPTALWRGSGTALLVDDEETIRVISSKQLQRLGFKVLMAENGQQAVDIYREHKEEIIVVVLDLTMPHMNGEEAFRELRQIDPNVRVILASGYSENDISSRFAGKGLAGYLQKPYTLTQLRSVLSMLCPAPESDGRGDRIR
jgi:two-component system, cell cycle sensor histidine kinase and response regulator CckA